MIDLLKSKLLPPLCSPHYIQRPHLIHCLDGSRFYQLTLLQAPAGYGKSTLVSQWIKQSQETCQTAWLSLDKHDNNPLLFWAYVFSSLLPYLPDLAAYTELFQTGKVDLEKALVGLVNALCECTSSVFLIIDDYHRIVSSQIHQEMVFLLEKCPPQLHLLLLTRSQPEHLLLNHMRAYDHILELNWKQLAFTRKQISCFLSTGQKRLSNQELDLVMKITEGWPLGVQLISLSLKNSFSDTVQVLLPDMNELVNGLSGVFREDIFQCFSESLKAFLLDICVVEYFTVSMCAYLSPVENIETHLTYLLDNGLLTCIDAQIQTYRLHPLFSDWLKQRLALNSAQHSRQFIKAGDLFLSQQDHLRSIESYLHVNALEQVASLLGQVIPLWRDEYRDDLVLYLLKKVPESLLINCPNLLFYYGLAFINCHQIAEAEQWIDQVHAHYAQGASNEVKGKCHILRASLIVRSQKVNHEKALSHLEEASRFLLEHTELEYVILKIKSYILNSQQRYSDLIVTLEPLWDRQENERADLSMESFIWRYLYISYFACGEFEKAKVWLQEALHLSQSGSRQSHPATVLIYAYLANLAHIKNETEEVEYYLGKMQSQPLRSSYYIEALYIGFHISLDRQHFDTCSSYLCQIKRLFLTELDQESYAWESTYDDLVLDLKLYQGEFEVLNDWIHQHASHSQLWEGEGFGDSIFLYRLSYYFFFKGEYQVPLHLLNEKIPQLEEKGLFGFLNDAYGLQAYANYILGDIEMAGAIFIKALHLAEKQRDIAWLFNGLCDFKHLFKLINIQEHTLGHAFFNGLKVLFESNQKSYPFRLAKPVALLIEQLSLREKEVFDLILEHQNNKQIADQLCVSNNTLKTHIRHIYQKLKVKSRKELKQILDVKTKMP